LFAGVLAGDLIDRRRVSARKPTDLQQAFFVAGAAGVSLGWLASVGPALYPTASFWHDSPTIFFIRLGAVAMLVPIAWTIEGVSAGANLALRKAFEVLVTLGRSSLFVYWIHVEMIYGVAAGPFKRQLPLWGTQIAWVLLCAALYQIVLWKNRLMERVELPRRARIFATVLR
jgi:hypothetical protein